MCQEFGLEIGNPAIPQLASGFAGGIGNSGAVCGAVVGGVMAIGLKLGRADTMEGMLQNLGVAREFRRRFEAEMGNIGCRELTGLDLTAEGADVSIMIGVSCNGINVMEAELENRLKQEMASFDALSSDLGRLELTTRQRNLENRQAVELDPDNHAARIRLGTLLLASNDLDEALAELRRQTRRPRRSPRVPLTLAANAAALARGADPVDR